MKSLARLVIRNAGDETDGFIMGALFKTNDLFKPGEVWEIREILGVPTLVKVGNSWIEEDCSSGNSIGWNADISRILCETDGCWILTEQEYEYEREIL